jgi:uncharacterized membrane protein HdeD (DUF308 family)
MERLKTVKTIYSAFSVSLIVLGAVLLIRPNMAAEVFCRICGILLLLFGIVKLFGYFSRDLLQLAFQFDFAMGIISCLIGLTMIFWSEQLMEVLIIGIGLFMLVDALLRIQTALDAKKIGVQRWWIILIVALITAVIGALLFLRPYNGLGAVVFLIGLNLVIDGILNLYVVQSTVSTIRRRKEWEA